MFNPKVCPLFQSKLSWGMRILYSSGVWAYMCAAISTPTFIMIPLVCPALLLLLESRTNCMHLLAIIQLYSFLCQDPSSVSLCLALSAERYVMQFSSLTLNDCMTGMTYKSPQCFTMTLIE